MDHINLIVDTLTIKNSRIQQLAFFLSILTILAFPNSGHTIEAPSSFKTITISDQTRNNQPPIAKITYSQNKNTITLNGSSSSDQDGNIVEYKWDLGDGSYKSGAIIDHTLKLYGIIPITLTVVDDQGGVGVGQLIINRPPFNKAINFQPATSPLAEGYLLDSGQSYSSTKGYGWLVNPNPSSRDRNNSLSPNQAYDTFLIIGPSGKWELDVPEGDYSVTICVGDPSYSGGLNIIQAESIDVINASLSKSPGWVEKTATIAVSDGKLTITFVGTNPSASFCWLKVDGI